MEEPCPESVSSARFHDRASRKPLGPLRTGGRSPASGGPPACEDRDGPSPAWSRRLGVRASPLGDRRRIASSSERRSEGNEMLTRTYSDPLGGSIRFLHPREQS